jgi:acyl-CoA dehydrogenase
MAWDFSTEPEFQAQLDWMRGFVDEEILPLEVLDLGADQYDAVTAPLKQRVKDRGLWAAHLGPELGGQGFGQVKLGLMHEILGRCRLAPAIFGNQAPDSGNAELLAIGADDEQKQRWLWPLLEGKVRSAYSMTERDVAGSDPTLIRTTAVRDGDEWVINGHKWFTSNGSAADFLIVMCRTNPDVPAYQGCSMIVVPTDAPGLDIVRDIDTMTHPEGGTFGRPGGHSEIVYRDVRVPLDHLIGREGEGFTLAQKRLGPGRIHHAMRWLGQSQRAFDMLCERALSRYAHGSLLAEKGQIQDWIAESWASMQAARLLTLQAAWKMDQEGASKARVEIAVIKYFGARVLYEVVDRAIQVHGSLGFSTDLPLELMYRHAREARFVDGPDEVHRQTVARQILKRYRAVDGLPSEHVPTRREAAERKFADLLDAAAVNT